MSDFLVDVSGVKGLPGGELAVDVSGCVNGGDYSGVVRLKGNLVNDGGILRFSGLMKGNIDHCCARCLAVVSLPYEAEVSFVASNAEGLAGETDDLLIFEDAALDLRPVVDGYVKADAPISVLCGDDCKGLCEVCGGDLNVGSCGCEKDLLNPVLDISRFLE